MIIPSSAVLAVVALAATTVDANCYTSGIKWPIPAVASYHIDRACNGYPGSNGEHIRGAFENVWFKANVESNLPASVCINESGYKIDLQVTNKGEARILSPAECFKALRSLVDCLRGGETDTSRFWFR